MQQDCEAVGFAEIANGAAAFARIKNGAMGVALIGHSVAFPSKSIDAVAGISHSVAFLSKLSRTVRKSSKPGRWKSSLTARILSKFNDLPTSFTLALCK